MKQGAEGMHAEAGGLASLPALDESDEDSDEDEDEDGGGEGGAASAGGGGGGGAAARDGRVREEVNFKFFESFLWPHMVVKAKPEAALGGHKDLVAELKKGAAALRASKGARRGGMEASIVFREIVSFIKGSSEALDAAEARAPCISLAPPLHLARPSTPPRLHLACTSPAPRLHLARTSPVTHPARRSRAPAARRATCRAKSTWGLARRWRPPLPRRRRPTSSPAGAPRCTSSL